MTDFSADFEPLDGLLDSIARDPSGPARSRALDRLRRLRRQGDSRLQRHVNELAELYHEAVRRNSNPDEIEQTEVLLAEKERSAAELFGPGIEKLKGNLARREKILDPELRSAFQAIIDIALAWLSRYREARHALLRLAAERRSAAGPVLRARPATNEINYSKLSREHIARYPKIRARLAE